MAKRPAEGAPAPAPASPASRARAAPFSLVALPLPLLHALVPFFGLRDVVLARTSRAMRRRLCAEDPASWRVALEVTKLRGFTPASAEAFLRREGWDVDSDDALTRESDWGVCALVAAIFRRRPREVAALGVLCRARLGAGFFARDEPPRVVDGDEQPDEQPPGARADAADDGGSPARHAVSAAVHTGQALELAPILLAVGCDARAPRIERDLPWDETLTHDAERETRVRAHAWLDLKVRARRRRRVASLSGRQNVPRSI